MTSPEANPPAQGFVLKRRLRIGFGELTPGALRDGLLSLAGVVAVTVNQNGKLRVAYDASQVQIDRIIDEIKSLGARPKLHGWRGLRVSWCRFVDANAAANAARTEVHCCNKPPRGR